MDKNHPILFFRTMGHKNSDIINSPELKKGRYVRDEKIKAFNITYIKVKFKSGLFFTLTVISNLIFMQLAMAQPSNFKLDFGSYRSTIETMRLQLSTAKQDTAKARLYITIADAFLDRPDEVKADMDSALFNLKRAMHFSRISNSKPFIHYTMMQYAQYYAEIQDKKMQSRTYNSAIAQEHNWNEKRLEAESRWFECRNIQKRSDSLARIDIELAYTLHRQILNKSITERLREVYLLKQIADLNLKAGHPDLCIKQLYEVIAVQQHYKVNIICETYDLLAGAYHNKGELSRSLFYAYKALKYVEKHKETGYLPYFSARVGEINAAIGNYSEAEIWYRKAFYAASKNGEYAQYFTRDFCLVLIQNGRAAKALESAVESMKFIRDTSSLDAQWIKLTIVDCLTALGNYGEAKKLLPGLIKFTQISNADTDFQREFAFSAGTYFLRHGQYDQAEVYLKKAFSRRKEMSLYMQMQTEKMLSDLQMAQNKPIQALISLKRYNKLRDVIYNHQKSAVMDRLHVEFNTAQKENENEILKKKSQLQQQELVQASFVRKTTIVGFFFLLLIIALIYSRFRLKSKVNKLILIEKDKVDQANQELELNVQQKTKLIAEKESLMKEIHHRVKNNLQLTMSLLNTQSYYLEDQSAKIAIAQSQHRLKSIALIHQKLYQGNNVGLIDIKPYIVELIAYLRETLSDGINISFEINLIHLEMEISQAVPLGLFINEAVTNIFKYAFPGIISGNIKITLSLVKNDSYQLLIKDNGIGLPEDFDKKHIKTLGLTLMQGLSRQIDGEFSITSEKGVAINLTFVHALVTT